jgi:hypothetical protein
MTNEVSGLCLAFRFAQCGKINVFKRGDANPVAIKDF